MTCTAPAAIPNGYFVGAKVTYAVNDIIQYVCDNHYVMSGSPSVICDTTGVWLPASGGSMPECSLSYFSNGK